MSAPPEAVRLSGRPPTVTERRPTKPAEDDAEAHEHDVGLARGTLDVAERLSDALDFTGPARDAQDVAAVHDGPGRDGHVLRPADDLDEREATPVRFGQLVERLVLDLAVRHDGVGDDDRPVEKLAVFTLDAEGRFLRKMNVAAGRDGQDIATPEGRALFTF